MSPLNDDDLRHFRDRLEAREAELGAELRAADAEANDAADSAARDHAEDIAERGEQRMRGAVRHAEKERDVAELRDIAAARERMAHGDYGVCIDCGSDIARARLEAEPAAARCLHCQQRYEQTHRRAGGPHVPRVI